MPVCECGCGETAKRRYISGHNLTGNLHWQWRDGRSTTGPGSSYEMVYAPNHPTADARGYVREHIYVVEKLIGPLPPNAVVHHIDEDTKNNANTNLVVCQDRAYHNLIHRRIRALRECGNANWRKCSICHQYDEPGNLRIYEYGGKNGDIVCHRTCSIEARRRSRKCAQR